MGRVKRKHIFSRSFSNHQKVLFVAVTLQTAFFEFSFHLPTSTPLLIYALLLWRYILIAFMLRDLWTVTANEPTDPLLTGALCSQHTNPDRLLFCILCQHLVFKDSHHCFRCERCSSDFDHHCKYLNVCIGGANYVPFLRLLASFMLYCFVAIWLSLWQEISWTITAELLISIVLLTMALILFGFHLYLNLVVRKTTFEYIISENESEAGGMFAGDEEVKERPGGLEVSTQVH